MNFFTCLSPSTIDTTGIQEYFSLAGTSLRYLKVFYNILVSLPIILFGYSLVTYSAISLISYLLVSVLIYFFTKKYYESRIQAFLASVLFLSIPASICYASMVLPDMIHALFIFISLLLVNIAVKRHNKNELFLFMAGIFWGLSLYLRRTLCFYLPGVYLFCSKILAKIETEICLPSSWICSYLSGYQWNNIS